MLPALTCVSFRITLQTPAVSSRACRHSFLRAFREDQLQQGVFSDNFRIYRWRSAPVWQFSMADGTDELKSGLPLCHEATGRARCSARSHRTDFEGARAVGGGS